jgi:tyrosinase
MAPSKAAQTMGRDSSAPVLLRDDILNLQDAFFSTGTLNDDQTTKKLAMQKLLWAFHKLQLADTKSWNSFFQISGFHGMPFRGAGWGNPAWWGGYCNHGNVLFPTWHRAYLISIENSLRQVSGCDDIALPYWDEIGGDALRHGLPRIFLDSTVDIPYSVTGKDGDGFETIDNPLRSYKFQDGVWDNLNPIPDADYSKPRNYETKRYPFSGLVSGGDGPATEQHNKLVANLKDPGTDDLLNQNVVNWLTSEVIINSDGKKIRANTRYKYEQCLSAPSYTVFSNTTSATQYNEDIFYNTPENTTESTDQILPAVSLESPHNDMHLAIGGFAIPGQGNVDPIIGANGDMGENDTAAFDPIFYFHHCFVDKVFWDWQRKWDSALQSRKQLVIDVGYPGTNSVDAQGPTPGVAGNVWLTMESPLAPFTKDDTQNGKPLTSNVS